MHSAFAAHARVYKYSMMSGTKQNLTSARAASTTAAFCTLTHQFHEGGGGHRGSGADAQAPPEEHSVGATSWSGSNGFLASARSMEVLPLRPLPRNTTCTAFYTSSLIDTERLRYLEPTPNDRVIVQLPQKICRF